MNDWPLYLALTLFSIPGGYVKTESVQIDFDALKNQGRPLPESDGDVYDDVGSQDDTIRYGIGALPQSAAVRPSSGRNMQMIIDLFMFA